MIFLTPSEFFSIIEPILPFIFFSSSFRRQSLKNLGWFISLSPSLGLQISRTSWCPRIGRIKAQAAVSILSAKDPPDFPSIAFNDWWYPNHTSRPLPMSFAFSFFSGLKKFLPHWTIVVEAWWRRTTSNAWIASCRRSEVWPERYLLMSFAENWFTKKTTVNNSAQRGQTHNIEMANFF